MNHWVLTLQPLVIGAVLLWSGGFKLLAPTAPIAAARSALRNLMGERRVVDAYRAVGLVEVAVAAGLLVPPSWPIPAAVLSVGFLGYLGYGRLAAPESSCGCSSARTTPIGWRNFANAGFLLLASVAAIPARESWAVTVGDRPVGALGVLLAEAAVVVTLNPDLDRYWLRPLRRLKVRLTHPLADAYSTEVPLEATVHRLQLSEAYRRVARLLRSDVLDSWDEGEWRIVRYALSYKDQRASAVFAVPRTGDDPDAVRVAVVSDTDESVLFSFGPADPALAGRP